MNPLRLPESQRRQVLFLDGAVEPQLARNASAFCCRSCLPDAALTKLLACAPADPGLAQRGWVRVLQTGEAHLLARLLTVSPTLATGSQEQPQN